MKLLIPVSVCFFYISLFEIKAEDKIYSDSTKYVHPLIIYNNEDSTVAKESEVAVDIKIFTGVYINNTFGIHPIFNLPVGIFYNDNFFNLDYEYRFGNSIKSYNISDNDTLKNTKVFSGQYFGFEYERILTNSEYHFLSFSLGIGYNWINIPVSKTISNPKTIDGLGINIGLGYSYLIHKRRGPYIVLMYHYSDLKNKGGSQLDANSYIIRITYGFGPNKMY